MQDIEKIKTALKENGLRVTKSRIAVATILIKNYGKPLSSEEIYQKVKSSEKSPPHTTPRGPSGYNLYVKNSGLPFKQAVSSWKALSESEKLKWNYKAKSI